VRETRSSSRMCLAELRTKSGFGDRSFSAAAPILWNSLPDRISKIANQVTFKQALKAWLFEQAFESTLCNDTENLRLTS
jgi:hypothetical protein